jgi:hypothetical protein
MQARTVECQLIILMHAHTVECHLIILMQAHTVECQRIILTQAHTVDCHLIILTQARTVDYQLIILVQACMVDCQLIATKRTVHANRAVAHRGSRGHVIVPLLSRGQNSVRFFDQIALYLRVAHSYEPHDGLPSGTTGRVANI